MLNGIIRFGLEKNTLPLVLHFGFWNVKNLKISSFNFNFDSNVPERFKGFTTGEVPKYFGSLNSLSACERGATDVQASCVKLATITFVGFPFWWNYWCKHSRMSPLKIDSQIDPWYPRVPESHLQSPGTKILLIWIEYKSKPL